MIDAWNALPLPNQLYWGLALLATLVTLIQTVLTIVGLGAETADVDMDLLDSPSGSEQSTGIGLFSAQTIFAFLTGLGWSGVVCTSLGVPLFLTGLISFFFGGGTMLAMYFLLAFLLSLQDRGNLDYATAVGTLADVYLRIPPAEQGGAGKVQVLVSGRLCTTDARSQSDEPIPTGSKVRVVRHLGDSCLLVERA